MPLAPPVPIRRLRQKNLYLEALACWEAPKNTKAAGSVGVQGAFVISDHWWRSILPNTHALETFLDWNHSRQARHWLEPVAPSSLSAADHSFEVSSSVGYFLRVNSSAAATSVSRSFPRNAFSTLELIFVGLLPVMVAYKTEAVRNAP